MLHAIPPTPRAYEAEKCRALYAMCFDWKAEMPGREVLLMGGDIHTGLVGSNNSVA